MEELNELKIHAATVRIFVQPNGVVHQEVQTYRQYMQKRVCMCGMLRNR